MSVPHFLEMLVGEWTGTNRLWLSPRDPAQQSATKASIALLANGQFITIRYTWEYESTPQEGWILLGRRTGLENIPPDSMQAVWIDSWHMQDQFMLCQGVAVENEAVRLAGTYAVPQGPDWGWWITVEAKEEDSWRLIMHNVPPDGEAGKAVEAIYGQKS